MCGDDVEEAALAAAGFTPCQDVAVDQIEGHRGTELVDAEEQRVIHRQPRRAR
jgi:hypothetical protein